MVATIKTPLEGRFRTGQKLQRRGTKHVKSGCKTCKVRRVKCDETRPACGRCTSTGRTCDGYGIWSSSAGVSMVQGIRQQQSSRFITPTVDLPPEMVEEKCCRPSLKDTSYTMFSLPFLLVDVDELICLDFFRLRCLTKLPGFFDATFWEQTIPQLSSSAPAVLHAVVALASTQRSQEYTSCMRKGPENPFFDYDSEIQKWDRFALQQYNKSITRLQSYFEDDSHESVQIALITCILFICIELMRGSYSRANVHIDHGINVLKTLQRRQKGPSVLSGKPCKTIVRVTVPKTVDDHLLEILARLNTQCVLYGYPSRFVHLTDTRTRSIGTMPNTFDSLQECRQYLEVLLNKALNLINKSKGNSPGMPLQGPELSLSESREQLLESVTQWKRAYESLGLKVRSEITIYSYMALTLLRVWSIKVEIMLLTCPAPNEPWSEMAFDKYTYLFEEILDLAAEMVMMRNYPGDFSLNNVKCKVGPLNFSADMGPVPVIYYTALKCRDPSIRRRAVQGLKIAPHREAVWDSVAVAAAAETVVRLEEGESFELHNAACAVSSSLDPHDVFSVPEWRRFQDVRIVMDDGLQPAGKIIGRRRCENDLYDSVIGQDESSSWEIIEESFQCGERVNTYTWSNIQDMYRAANMPSADISDSANVYT